MTSLSKIETPKSEKETLHAMLEFKNHDLNEEIEHRKSHGEIPFISLFLSSSLGMFYPVGKLFDSFWTLFMGWLSNSLAFRFLGFFWIIALHILFLLKALHVIL
jgi:hypothetical protein